eukprot:gb/GEZN01009716.1/.p1 GENE.gb/GEZN01009716.1/~~gb/GEZN01009716.1/.p1  ORF type:complete len:294 (-),score=11.59 gb/GEZN01009716.1/:345-1226(-)
MARIHESMSLNGTGEGSTDNVIPPHNTSQQQKSWTMTAVRGRGRGRGRGKGRGRGRGRRIASNSTTKSTPLEELSTIRKECHEPVKTEKQLVKEVASQNQFVEKEETAKHENQLGIAGKREKYWKEKQKKLRNHAEKKIEKEQKQAEIKKEREMKKIQKIQAACAHSYSTTSTKFIVGMLMCTCARCGAQWKMPCPHSKSAKVPCLTEARSFDHTCTACDFQWRAPCAHPLKQLKRVGQVSFQFNCPDCGHSWHGRCLHNRGFSRSASLPGGKTNLGHVWLSCNDCGVGSEES